MEIIKAEKRTVIANIIFNITYVNTGEIIAGFDGVGKSSVANSKLTINEKGEEVYENDDSDSNSNTAKATIIEGKSTNILTHTIKIGTEQYS